MKPEELIRSIKQKNIRPLYLLFGEEEYLIQEAVDLIISSIVDPGSSDFNFNTVYCKGTSANEIINLCQSLPFMAERRLVIAKEIEALKASDVDELAAYLQSPSPSTCLVMTSNQPRFEKKAVLGPVEEHGAAVRFFKLLDSEMSGWIGRWVRERGLAIQPDAVQYVWQTLGNDLQAINNELEKVVIYVKDRKAITFDDVRRVVGNFREYTPFDLADAIGKRDSEAAFLILARLIQEGESPVGLLGSIAWNFRRLLNAKSMESAGTGIEEIKKKHRIIFHQAASFQAQLRSRTLGELEAAIGILMDTDRMLKSSGLGGRLVLERMILRLC